MVKIPGPLMSISAAGWLGGDTYGKREYEKGVWIEPKRVNPAPYPIGLGSNILVPSGWTFGNHGNTYKIPRWGLRPYGPFISNYYSNLGWCYQRRRTWHGIIYSAIRPPISENKKSLYQLGYQGKFRRGIEAWQGMNQATKDVYNSWRHPAKASGYNRFLSWYLDHTSPIFAPPVLVDSYSEENQVSQLPIGAVWYPSVGQSFTANGGILNSAKFFLFKYNLPIGPILVKIYAHAGVYGTSSVPTGNPLAVSDPVDASNLTDQYQLISFSFSGKQKIPLTNGTKYVVTIWYGGGDMYNDVLVGDDYESPTHSGNGCIMDYGVWAPINPDLVFYVYKDGEM